MDQRKSGLSEREEREVRALQRRLAVDELGTLVDLLPPSNPVVSLGPVLAVAGVRDALRADAPERLVRKVDWVTKRAMIDRYMAKHKYMVLLRNQPTRGREGPSPEQMQREESQ